jgi:hypothetical protein
VVFGGLWIIRSVEHFFSGGEVMRKIGLLTGAFVVAGLSVHSVRANLLLDAGFEAPDASTADVEVNSSQATAAVSLTDPWYDLLNYSNPTFSADTAFISSDIPAPTSTADRINSGSVHNTANTGDQYGYAYTIGRSAGTVGGLGQLVIGLTAGDTYIGSAYFFVKQNSSSDGDRLQGGSADSVQLIFQDATGTQIGPTILSTASLTTTPVNAWTKLTTAPVIAPAGTAQVVFELADTRGTGGGVLFADDASLVDTSSVPEPGTLSLLGGLAAIVGFRRRR